MRIKPRSLTEGFIPTARRTNSRALLARHAHARGQKGKGADGGGIESANTLQSRTVVRIIDLISEGPIGGLKNGAQSIYFNGVPLQNANGSYNFKGVTWEVRFGLPTQDPVAGFPAAEDTFAIGAPISNEDGPYIHVVTNPDVTRCAVTVSTPSMFIEDTSNGNITPASAGIKIEVQPADGSYTTVISDTIAGKCTSDYQRTYTFVMPGAGPWNVRISRTTPDSSVSTTQTSTNLDAIDEIVDYALIYPDSAYVAITFDSELFGSTLPTRTYDVAGLMVQVPANYDPVTRTYATTGTGTSGGTWDGATMVAAATNNPAWILYDLLGNTRYGAGLPAAALEATKWDLYVIGQYCDGTIPDGFGGTMPRYSCDVAVSTRDDAYTIIQAFLSIFRGLSYWGAGTVRIVADMPTAVSKLVTKSDVIGGKFTYQGTALRTRHSMAIASFTDPDNQWQPTPVGYQYPSQIVTTNNGQNIAQITAFGATSRGQAYLAGKWMLDSEQHQTDTVTYQAGLDHLPGLEHLSTMPGSVIEIMDPAYLGVRWGGRIVSAMNASGVTYITVDSPPKDPSGSVVTIGESTWLLDVEIPGFPLVGNAAVAAFITNEDGSFTIQMAEQLPDLPTNGAQWILKSTANGPRLFRVIAMTEPQRGTLEITALFHDPTKYDRVELGIDLSDNAYYSFSYNPYTDAITAPSNITVNDYFVGEGSTTVLQTTVGWTASPDPRVLTYDVEASGDTGYTNTWTGLAGPSYEVDNLPVGNYVFGVRGVTGDGRQSVWALSPQLLINGQPIVPPAPAGLTAVGGTRLVSLSWESVAIANLYYYEVWRAPDESGTAGTFSMLAEVSATSFTDNDGADLLPLTTWWYNVRAVTTNLMEGSFATAVSAETTQLLTNDLANAILNTAKFAQGIAPIGLIPTGTSLPSSVSAAGGLSVIFNENDGQLYRWNGTAFTTAVPATSISGELTAAQIASLATDQLTGQIQAGQLAAASVLAENLAVGSPTNYIWNSCLGQTTDGWGAASFGSGAAAAVFFVGGATGWTTYSLAMFGSGIVYSSSVPAGGGVVAWWAPDSAFHGVSVVGSTSYAGAALVITSGSPAYAQIAWYDATGTFISFSTSSLLANYNANGTLVGDYVQVSIIATSPPTAAYAQLQIGCSNTGSAAAGVWVCFTQAQFGPISSNATTIGPWQPGGVTTISGGVITANSIQGNRIIAGTLDASAITANSITAGQIAAGAISTSELAAGAIEATNLAADFALANYEQVGYLTVTTFNISDDSITSFATATNDSPGGSGGLNGNGGGGLTSVLTLAVSVPQDRPGQIFPTFSQGISGGVSGSYAYHIKITQDGTVIYDREPGAYVDFPAFSLPVTLSASAANSFEVYWNGDTNVSLSAVSLTVFGRIK